MVLKQTLKDKCYFTSSLISDQRDQMTSALDSESKNVEVTNYVMLIGKGHV